MRIKKNSNIVFIIIFFIIFLSTASKSAVYSKLYSKENISNYFSGIILLNNFENKEGIKYLKNTKELKNIHAPYAKKLTNALVLDGKVQQAIYFVNNLKFINKNFFESNILLGINNLLDKEYDLAVNYFTKIVKNKKYNNFEKLIIYNILTYQEVFENKKINLSKKIPKNVNNINEALLNCYLDNDSVDSSFKKLINSKEVDYTRYIYFYVNYLINKKRYKEALNIVESSTDEINSNLLLDQTKIWLKNYNYKNIKSLFNCRSPGHLISELFYLIANLYSAEENYYASNFYINLSNYLNPKFIFNKALLAENFSSMEKYEKSKEIYKNFEKKYEIYHWYGVKKISYIESKKNNNKKAIEYFKKNYNKLQNPTLKNFYDAANFYKNLENYEQAIKYYSKVLESLNQNHPLYSSILYRRGGSYERIKNWKKSDEDLLESLILSPKDAHALNYLAYSWLERNHNLEKSMDMLITAHNLKPNDPYILDSIGWAYFLKGEYEIAQKFLKKAVILMPSDPIVNDHYADILWKLNKKIQAKYFWKYVLSLEKTELKMKKIIEKKIIFGV